MGAFDELQLAVDNLSSGRNVCMLIDDAGGIQYPSIYVRFPKGSIADAIGGSNVATHPAFIVGSAEKSEFRMGKYIGRIVNGYMLSLPLQDPSTGQNTSGGLNFDQALAYARANGDGHHLATTAENAWIALRCKMAGFQPRGNNQYGKDYSRQYEKGTVTYQYTSGGTTYDGRTATGSGPVSWNHDGTQAGVCDLNANVNEWEAGYRTKDGEIQIMPNNNAAINAGGIMANLGASSDEWKGILQDGSLVTPGTASTLKLDYASDPGTASAALTFLINTVLAHPQTVEAPYGAMSFASLSAASGVTIPDIMKYLALYPYDTGDYGGDSVYIRNIGERLTLRFAYWLSTSDAGLWYRGGSYPRSFSGSGLSGRPAYIEQDG